MSLLHLGWMCQAVMNAFPTTLSPWYSSLHSPMQITSFAYHNASKLLHVLAAFTKTLDTKLVSSSCSRLLGDNVYFWKRKSWQRTHKLNEKSWCNIPTACKGIEALGWRWRCIWGWTFETLDATKCVCVIWWLGNPKSYGLMRALFYFYLWIVTENLKSHWLDNVPRMSAVVSTLAIFTVECEAFSASFHYHLSIWQVDY